MPKKTTSSASDLLAAMEKLGGTGQFATSGTRPFFLPELFVEGVGEVAFPLVPAQIRELLATAEEAPFGQGEKTVHDRTVRQCHQLDAARLEFRSPEWKKYLKEILTQIREDLGIESKISAHPYKLLIYGPGGHFRPHRDTEKLDAMFGTLLIALPSSHEGGLLTIRHGGEEVAVDFSDPRHTRAFQHVAFFADCEHGVEPVREGYRCCVVYNLRLDSGSPGRLNRSVEEQARTLVPLLQSLAGDMAADPMAVLLDHGYTQANFSLANLKGRDRLRARALLYAADQADLTAHLALLELHQSGELEMEYRGRGRRGWGGYGEWDVDPENGTMGEIHEESLTLPTGGMPTTPIRASASLPWNGKISSPGKRLTPGIPMRRRPKVIPATRAAPWIIGIVPQPSCSGQKSRTSWFSPGKISGPPANDCTCLPGKNPKVRPFSAWRTPSCNISGKRHPGGFLTASRCRIMMPHSSPPPARSPGPKRSLFLIFCSMKFCWIPFPFARPRTGKRFSPAWVPSP
jgi:hypothetical protein